MLIVAVTGGIGSGKSTVVDLFRQHGVPVIDTDLISRELVEQPEILETLVNAFGDDILDQHKRLDRARLRQMTFSDSSVRLKLQDILHPLIHQAVLSRLDDIKADYCLLVIPLLYESKFSYPSDRVLVIDADPERQIQRTMQRDQTSREAVEKILTTQASPEQRRTIATDIIDNNGQPEQLETQVDVLHKRFLAAAKQGKESQPD